MLPTLEELLAFRATAARWSLNGLTRAGAAPLGARRSAHRGRGLEFEEVRAYVAGDDLRSIHWRVTARRGRPHTKLFREERERPVWLLVDLQAGMFFGSRVQLKSALAVRAAALLAWAAVGGGDRVGAVIGNGGELRCLAPRARESGVLPLLRELIALQPRAPAVPAEAGLAEALRQLAALARPGSLILGLSDFARLDAATEARWLALAERNECRLFQVSDPLEREGLPDGRFRGGLPGRLQAFDGAAIRAAWRSAWQSRELRVGALARRMRAPLLALDTATEVALTLAPLLRGAKRAA